MHEYKCKGVIDVGGSQSAYRKPMCLSGWPVIPFHIQPLPIMGIKPGSHRWEASALSTVLLWTTLWSSYYYQFILLNWVTVYQFDKLYATFQMKVTINEALIVYWISQHKARLIALWIFDIHFPLWSYNYRYLFII